MVQYTMVQAQKNCNSTVHNTLEIWFNLNRVLVIKSIIFMLNDQKINKALIHLHTSEMHQMIILEISNKYIGSFSEKSS